MREFLVYTAARFAVFIVCVAAAFALFALLGVDDDTSILVPLLLGAVASVVVSAWLLRGLRERFVLAVQARAERRVAVRDERSADEQAGE
jgi:hypothetical protein